MAFLGDLPFSPNLPIDSAQKSWRAVKPKQSWCYKTVQQYGAGKHVSNKTIKVNNLQKANTIMCAL